MDEEDLEPLVKRLKISSEVKSTPPPSPPPPPAPPASSWDDMELNNEWEERLDTEELKACKNKIDEEKGEEGEEEENEGGKEEEELIETDQEKKGGEEKEGEKGGETDNKEENEGGKEEEELIETDQEKKGGEEKEGEKGGETDNKTQEYKRKLKKKLRREIGYIKYLRRTTLSTLQAHQDIWATKDTPNYTMEFHMLMDIRHFFNSERDAIIDFKREASDYPAAVKPDYKRYLNLGLVERKICHLQSLIARTEKQMYNSSL
ncbi:hypothetical protein ACOMHN_050976 [Nucella lapillus]